MPHNLTEAGKTVAMIVREALDRGAMEVEVTQEAQDDWVSHLLTGPGRMMNNPDCTPGYYNNEGQPNDAARYAVGYPAGSRRLLPLHRRMAALGAVRGVGFPLIARSCSAV